MIVYENDQFFCSVCKSSLTVVSQNKGQGFSARCSTCKRTYYYPACEKCGQATWKHDEDNCRATQANAKGMRYCRKCKIDKSLSDFNMNGNSVSARCKKCQSEYFSEWYRRGKRVNEIELVDEDDILEELFGA